MTRLLPSHIPINNDFTLLPDSYLYPGVNYWLTAASLLPELTNLAAHHDLDPSNTRQRLLATLHDPEFRLRLRRLYSLIASLTPLWVYLMIFIWRHSWPAALFGSLLVALSWEVVYQSKWIAPDPIVMQFGALTQFLVFLSWTGRKKGLLYAAAVAAALACGTKYPGGMLLLPVLCAAWLDGVKPFRVVKTTFAIVCVFTITYLFTTPGTVLQPFKFQYWIEFAKGVYSGGWYGYTVHPGLRHCWKIITYFSTQLFSTNAIVSILLFLLVPVGLFAVVRGCWREAVILLIFPALYLVYFSEQQAMIVRNYLVLVPFIVVLGARGWEWLQARIPNRRARVALSGLIVVLFSFNAVQGIQASNSVAHRRDKDAFLRQFTDYVSAHPRLRILISPALEVKLRERRFWPSNLISQKDTGFGRPFDEYASYYSETVSPRSWEWVTNRPGTFAHVFGPREVNLSYYTGWLGDDRIITLTNAHFHKWRVDKPRLRSGP